MTREDIQSEIVACKMLLADSDYAVLKTVEGLLSCTSVSDMLRYILDVPDDIMDKVHKRAQWRRTINACEDELARLGDAGGDVP